MQESLDHLLAGEDLLDVTVQVGQVLLQVFEVLTSVCAEEVGRIHDHGEHPQGDKSEPPVKNEHHDDDSYHLHNSIDDLGECVRYQLSHGIDVTGEEGHDLPVRSGVIELHGHILQFAEQVISQP